MNAIIRKIVTVVEETYLEMRSKSRSADTAGSGDCRYWKSVCRQVRQSLAFD